MVMSSAYVAPGMALRAVAWPWEGMQVEGAGAGCGPKVDKIGLVNDWTRSLVVGSGWAGR